jgi:hypothetical protein
MARPSQNTTHSILPIFVSRLKYLLGHTIRSNGNVALGSVGRQDRTRLAPNTAERRQGLWDLLGSGDQG